MNKKIGYSFLGLLLLCQCEKNFSYTPVDGKQPFIVQVSPQEGALIDSLESIKIEFSIPIQPQTVNEKTFLIFPSVLTNITAMSPKELLSKIEDDELQSSPGTYRCADDQLSCEWLPSQTLESLHQYNIVVTSQVMSQSRYPLNQKTGVLSPQFVSSFILGGEASQSSSISSEKNSKMHRPEQLIINEIFYDAQESETDGNIFVEIYGTPQSDLSGYILRFINGGDGQKTDEIIFSNSAIIPEDGFFVVADAQTGSENQSHVQEADYIENFDPQNGPDSIQLIDVHGQVLDVVGYGELVLSVDQEGNAMFELYPSMDVNAGFSLSRVDRIDANNNQQDFVMNEVPSPGKADVTNALLHHEDNNLTPDENIDFSPNDVYLSEVVTDPQQDWNDTDGGNGIIFDSIVGTGTIGSSDEWIEIKNGSNVSVDLTEWSLEMLDGTDEVEVFGDSDSSFIFFSGGSIENFIPQETLVIGDPSGDMKNTITIKLFDDSDELIDEVEVDDANADEIDDESFQLFDDVHWQMSEATIGF